MISNIVYRNLKATVEYFAPKNLPDSLIHEITVESYRRGGVEVTNDAIKQVIKEFTFN